MRTSAWRTRSPGPLVAVVDDDEAVPLQHLERDLLDIAGERLAGRVGQQIERGAGLALARLDRGVEADESVVVVGVGQALGLGVDRAGDLLVDDRDDLPGDDREHDAGADGADGQDRQRETKGGGAEDLSERRHVSCIRRRARCSAAARRSPGRSWPAAARHGRRSHWSGGRNGSPRRARAAWCG